MTQDGKPLHPLTDYYEPVWWVHRRDVLILAMLASSAGLLCGVILGALMAQFVNIKAMVFIPLSLVMFPGMIVGFLAPVFRIRHPVTIAGVCLLVATGMTYAYWVGWLSAIIDFQAIAWRPDQLLRLTAEIGRNAIVVEDNGAPSSRISGQSYVAGLLAGQFVALGVAMFVSPGVACFIISRGKPRCRRCNRKLKWLDNPLVFACPARHEKLVEQITEGNVEGLATAHLHQSRYDTPAVLHWMLHHCSQCQDQVVLSIWRTPLERPGVIPRHDRGHRILGNKMIHPALIQEVASIHQRLRDEASADAPQDNQTQSR